MLYFQVDIKKRMELNGRVSYPFIPFVIAVLLVQVAVIDELLSCLSRCLYEL